MKKILFFITVLFLSINIVNADSKFYLGDKISNMTIEAHKGSLEYIRSPYVLFRDDNSFVYCIDPFTLLNENDYIKEYNYNDSIFGLSSEELDRINLISYYGYGYNNHTDLKWYGVTQFLIWKTLNLDSINFVDIDYSNELKELEDLVNNYYLLPHLENKYYYSINTNYEILDINNVLNNYEIISSNIDSRIENNKLIINTNNEGIYTIKLRRNVPIIDDYKLYYMSGYQSLIKPGKVNDIEFSIDIEVSSGSIIINKKDSENIIRREATLEGAKYGLYKDNILINTLVTDNNGYSFLDNIPYGKYVIKEIQASNGYYIDKNNYNININYNNKNIILNLKEDVKKSILEIRKYYGDNNYQPEIGAEFKIYDINNNLVDVLVTDNNGMSSITLEYGLYNIIQTKGIDGYDYIKDTKVQIGNVTKTIQKFYDKKTVIIEEDNKQDIIVENNKEDIIEEKQKNEDKVLEVNVPNTKVNYNYSFLFLILLGISFILIYIKNTTHFE